MTKHPDMVPYACEDPKLTVNEIADIDEHLHSCAECRDLVLFIQKMNSSLGHEVGVKRWKETQNIAKVLEDNDWDEARTAEALGMSYDVLLAQLEKPALRWLVESKLKQISADKTKTKP